MGVLAANPSYENFDPTRFRTNTSGGGYQVGIIPGPTVGTNNFLGPQPTYDNMPSNTVVIPFADPRTSGVSPLPLTAMGNMPSDYNIREFILWAKGNHLNEVGYDTFIINNWWAPTNDANGNICFDPLIFNGIDGPIQTAEQWTNFVTTNGFRVGFQIQLWDIVGGTSIESNWAKVCSHMVKDWGSTFVLFDAGTTTQPQRFAMERAARTLRQICFTNKLQDIHLSISAAAVPGENAFQPYIATIGNSWTLSFDGIDLEPFQGWGDLLSHNVKMLATSQYVGPGHTYNENELLRFHGQTNMFKGALGSRAMGPAAIFLSDTNLTQLELALLTNSLFRRIHQDPLVNVGRVVWTTNNGTSTGEVWLRDLTDGQKAVMLLNKGTNISAIPFNVPFRVLGLGGPGASYLFTDVWPQTNFTATSSLVRTLETNSADLFIVTPIQPSPGASYFIRLITTTAVPLIGDVGTNGSVCVNSNGTVWLVTATNGTVIRTKLGP